MSEIIFGTLVGAMLFLMATEGVSRMGYVPPAKPKVKQDTYVGLPRNYPEYVEQLYGKKK